MNILCSIFGHKWDKEGKYEQSCKRKKCIAFRTLFVTQFPFFRFSLPEWRVIDFDKDLKLK